MAKKKSRVQCMGYAIDELKDQHQGTSTTPNHCQPSSIIDSFRTLSPPQLNNEVTKRHEQGRWDAALGKLNSLSRSNEANSMSSYQETVGTYKSMTREDDEYSDSLYVSQSPKSACSILASPEPPLYSDIDNPLDDYQDILKVNDFRTFEGREEPKFEGGSRKGSAYTDDLRHPNVSPLTPIGPTEIQYTIPDTIHELPAEPPARSPARPQPYRGPMGSSSSSTLPDLDHSGTRSPSLPNPPITPLSPALPSPLLIRPPWPSAASSKSSHSHGSIKVRPSNFQEQQVEVCSTRKVKFNNSRKRADYVSLSPDCTHAAFVFSDQVQVCRDVSNLEGNGGLETEVMLKLEKKAGKFIAASLSDTHLVAISDKQVRTPVLEVPRKTHITVKSNILFLRADPNMQSYAFEVCDFAQCPSIQPRRLRHVLSHIAQIRHHRCRPTVKSQEIRQRPTNLPRSHSAIFLRSPPRDDAYVPNSRR